MAVLNVVMLSAGRSEKNLTKRRGDLTSAIDQIMKSSLARAFVCGAAGFLVCCNKQSATKPAAGHTPQSIQRISASVESSSVTKQNEISSVSFRGVTKQLREIRSSGGSSGFGELKTNLLALAEHEGKSPMTIAARIVLEIGDMDEQQWAIENVQTAFPDIDSKAELANAIPAGKLRSLMISHLSSQFAQSGDLDGMKKLYDSIPVGKDRRQLSIDAASLTLAKLGLPSALDFVANLEMPDERFVAYNKIATRENFRPYAGNDAIAAKNAAVIASFDEQHRKIYSLSNRKWH